MGQLYSLRRLENDLQSVLSTGLFEDAVFLPQPAESSTVEAPRVDVTLLMREKRSGVLSAGTGVLASGRGGGAAGADAPAAPSQPALGAAASIPSFMGQLQYNQRNLFGLGQRLQALVELGQANSNFSFVHEDPWVLGDAHRTARTVALSSNRLPADAVFGAAPGSPALAEGPPGAVHVARLGGSIEWNRPLGVGWTGSLALGWQRATSLDERGRRVLHDRYAAPLHLGGRDRDTKATGTLRLSYA